MSAHSPKHLLWLPVPHLAPRGDHFVWTAQTGYNGKRIVPLCDSDTRTTFSAMYVGSTQVPHNRPCVSPACQILVTTLMDPRWGFQMGLGSMNEKWVNERNNPTRCTHPARDKFQTYCTWHCILTGIQYSVEVVVHKRPV